MFWSTNLTVIHATDGTLLSKFFLVLWMVCSVCPWMDNWAPYFDVLEMGLSWAAARPAAVALQNRTFHCVLSFFPPLHPSDRSRGLNKRGNKNFTSSQAPGVSHIRSVSTACLLSCFFPLRLSLLHLWTSEAREQMWLQTRGLNTHLHATPVHMQVCTDRDRRSASHLFHNKAKLCALPKHFCIITKI